MFIVLRFKCCSALRFTLKCRCICAQQQANGKEKSVLPLHMSHFVADAPTKPNGLFSLFSVRHMDRAFSPFSLGNACPQEKFVRRMLMKQLWHTERMKTAEHTKRHHRMAKKKDGFQSKEYTIKKNQTKSSHSVER